MFALNLAEDGRILSATFSQFASSDAIIVTNLPEGNIADYCYVEEKFVYEPLPTLEESDPDNPVSLEARVKNLEETLDILLSGIAE